MTFASFAHENREMMIYFPQYEAEYKKRYLSFLALSLVYPVGYIGASIACYMYLEYFRRMVELVMYETSMFCVCSCIFGLLYCVYRLM